MVAGEAPAESSTETDLGQRLVDCYETFMATEPLILRKKTGRQLSEQACQDVAQEAYMKVARKVAAGQLPPQVRLPGYLRRTSRNLAIDYLRAQARLDPLDDELVVAVPVQRRPSDDIDPLEELVVPAIDAMPLSRRRKIVQLQSQGLDDKQIAKALGIAAARIHRDRHAAVSELRGELGEYIRDGHRKQTRRVKKDR
ncbi:RNA polymerase sigma factor [Streptomyces sp. NPDC058855]|uniref:RNA polymerase sigma factor n=1 Tax=Streptomyces sp. NPDC058855 TaxID=3346651 RepID=UPI00369C57E4